MEKMEKMLESILAEAKMEAVIVEEGAASPWGGSLRCLDLKYRGILFFCIWEYDAENGYWEWGNPISHDTWTVNVFDEPNERLIESLDTLKEDIATSYRGVVKRVAEYDAHPEWYQDRNSLYRSDWGFERRATS
ncbi:MAG: hypothetical protein LBQ02_04120 [Candidatus Nomurabacteria bacterium]|jgi:hypothetical protein|nr:hypothetical protein [Candidatus Nomurabacteria bacterium]